MQVYCTLGFLQVYYFE